MQVSELMTHHVVTAYPETPVVDVAESMLQHNVSGVPIIDHDGHLVGIVTEADLVVRNANVHFPTFLQILDARIYLTSTRHFEDELRKALGTVAGDVMTRDVQTVRPNDDISVAATLMADRGLNPIPVTENRRLRGIISRSDIIRHILAQEATGSSS